MQNYIKKIGVTCNKLKDYIYQNAGPIDEIYYLECDYKIDNNIPTEGWVPFFNGTSLSGKDRHYWFKLKFKTPKEKDNNLIVLRTSTGHDDADSKRNPQSMVFINGKNKQALDTNHRIIRLEYDKTYEIYIYFYMGMFEQLCPFTFSLDYENIYTKQLYYDMIVPFRACVDVYSENSYEYINTMKILQQACNVIDLNYTHTEEYDAKNIEAINFLKREYYDELCGDSPIIVNCIGHTHIDVAWLWTIQQTREKTQRSFATVLELMKHYPEYKFMMSQPQLFEFLSKDDPDLYLEVKKAIAAGKWEVEGAMWLEADCNLISGESMVRQILYGKSFFKEEFGVDCKVLWLPDVFGYSAAMPQVLKKSGIDYFVTSKISWNDTNMFPYDTFMWQGIDGSEIFTSFITTQEYNKGENINNETTYVGNITPSMVAGTWKRYQQKEYSNEVMLPYGYGDGGGGPTEEMLEYQRRLAKGLPGMPKTKIVSLKEHLSNLKDNFLRNSKLLSRMPKWIGELYLEFHRGTYTSMAKNKKYNRYSEMMLQKLEALSTTTSVMLNEDYNKDEIDCIWKTVLLNQFHDIIPGSSIREVYEYSWNQYEKSIELGERTISNKLSAIANNINSDGGVLVYNSIGFENNGFIELDGKCYETGIVPSYGWKVIKLTSPQNKVIINGLTVENDFFILQLDKAGRFVKLFDKRLNRDLIKESYKANEFHVFEDIPSCYDNWEIEQYYYEKFKILIDDAEITVVDEGCRKGFCVKRKYAESIISQYIYLYNSIERIDVKNVIDWKESNQLLKIAFPFNIHANKAIYDIQFGNVERNTHRNTSWDTAKFEVCAHKWVDVSEYGYGVSLLNDCKYGYSIDEGVLKLTAIKCGTWPNERADKNVHIFSYSIFPHKGDFREGNTVREAYLFNQALSYTTVDENNHGILPNYYEFVKTDNENIVIDTIKLAENGDGIIVRLFDAYNCKSNIKLDFARKIKSVYLCDLLENELYCLGSNGNSVSFEMNNYEIATFKISFE